MQPHAPSRQDHPRRPHPPTSPTNSCRKPAPVKRTALPRPWPCCKLPASRSLTRAPLQAMEASGHALWPQRSGPPLPAQPTVTSSPTSFPRTLRLFFPTCTRSGGPASRGCASSTPATSRRGSGASSAGSPPQALMQPIFGHGMRSRSPRMRTWSGCAPIAGSSMPTYCGPLSPRLWSFPMVLPPGIRVPKRCAPARRRALCSPWT